MGNDRHLQISVWRCALQIASSLPRERKHFWLGDQVYPSRRCAHVQHDEPWSSKQASKQAEAEHSWLHWPLCPTHHRSTAGEIVPRVTILRNCSVVTVLPRPHVTLSSAVNTAEAGAVPLKIFTLGWFSPPREKNFVFPHLFKRLARKVQVLLKLFWVQQHARLFLHESMTISLQEEQLWALTQLWRS